MSHIIERQKLAFIEQYKHFKGIYLERVKEYYLCDFYEMKAPDGSISYRVCIEMNGHKQITEMQSDESNSWRFAKIATNLPEELEGRLSECIIKRCLRK